MSHSEAVDNAAKNFEAKHYKDTNDAGEAQPLSAEDFKNAANSVSESITSAAQAVVGKEGHEPAESSEAGRPNASRDTPADEPPLAEKIPNAIAATLDSMQHAVQPATADTSDPEVSEFKGLVAEALGNMKESIAVSAPSKPPVAAAEAVAEPTKGVADSLSPAISQQDKHVVASSPAEPQQTLLMQMKVAGVMFAEALVPTAHADGRSSGNAPGHNVHDAGVGEGESKGLIQDLGQTAEVALEAITHRRHDAAAGGSAEGKWSDAKEEARESGRQANAATRDAFGALGDKVDRWGNKVSAEADKAGDKVDRWGKDAKNEVENAADRAGDTAWNADAKARGAAAEVADLTRNAAARVKGDWQDVKRATEETANNSSAARGYNDNRPVVQEEGGGFFGWVKTLTGNGSSQADDIAENAKANGRSAADSVKYNARSAADTVQDKAQEGKDAARGWFGAASDEADDVASRTRRTVNNAADDISDKAEDGKQKARGWFNSAADSADDTTSRARRSANRTANDVQEKVEDGKQNARGWFNSGSSAAHDASGRGQRTADKAGDKAEYYADRAGDNAEHYADRLADNVKAGGDKANHYARKAGDKLSRFGSRVSNAAEDAEQWTKDTVNEVEDYVTADLRPRSSLDANFQRGLIPSNTADVLAARFSR